ncbi:MAG: glucose-6-phosphate dehydrogenase, partial [Hyphomicrobiales bacterium]|nr:glucose-6-phosphate dehydrogenase [Hyphomicrobiales bacterium]
MTPRTIPVDVFDLIVFGATGDLAQRKLLPALFHRDVPGQIPPSARIIGSSRRAMTREAFRAFALASIETHVSEDERKPDTCKRFLDRLDYVAAEASQ